MAAVTVPIAVILVGFVVTRRQARNSELTRVRLDYYRQLAPDLNRLMCYISFVGTWKSESPVEIVALKRRLDANFHCAAPLFRSEVGIAYSRLMDDSFVTYGRWGADARIRTSAYQRRRAWRGDDAWDPAWDAMFAIDDKSPIAGSSLLDYRRDYDALLRALVEDMGISRPRQRYSSDRVVMNAHAPQLRDIEGGAPNA